MQLGKLSLLACVSGSILLLSACGGGVESASSAPTTSGTPTPSPTPTPSGTPTPTTAAASQPIPPAHPALVSSAPFGVLAVGYTYKTDVSGENAVLLTGPAKEAVRFSYDSGTSTYQISLPGFQPGTVINTGYGGSAGELADTSSSQVSVGASNSVQSVQVWLPVPGQAISPYTYTSFGEWSGQTGVDANGSLLKAAGTFAYGIPTPATGVPINGTATYSATVRGNTLDPNFAVGGTATLNFDFAAGVLSGHLDPTLWPTYGIGEQYGIGRYDFTNTVFGIGSTTYSGSLSKAGLAGSGQFDGSFTGPQAQELMGRFTAPYSYNGQQGTMYGAWIGKKN